MKEEALVKEIKSFCKAACTLIPKHLSNQAGQIIDDVDTENKLKYLKYLGRVVRYGYCLCDKEVYNHTLGLKRVKDHYGYCKVITYAHHSVMSSFRSQIYELSLLYHANIGVKRVAQMADGIHEKLKGLGY